MTPLIEDICAGCSIKTSILGSHCAEMKEYCSSVAVCGNCYYATEAKGMVMCLFLDEPITPAAAKIRTACIMFIHDETKGENDD